MAVIDRLIGRIVREGELKVVMPSGREHRFGTPNSHLRPVRITLKDRKTIRKILRNPRLGVGEAYMNGDLAVDGDIYDFLRLVTWNVRWERGGKARKVLLKRSPLREKLAHFNWKSRSKRNVAHHYNLGNRLYELCLDRDLFYTCGFFADRSATIDEAQQEKVARMIAKLRLQSGQRVLDFGCGWGGLAISLARAANITVVGVTLSEEQLVYARKRADEAGVSDRVEFQLTDYRDVKEEESFDAITCSGMMEHIGPPQYETFFHKCRELLKQDGVLLLDFIGRLGKPGTTDPWVAKYIFPGGYIPALSEVVEASERSRMICQDVEQWPIHYADTCRRWLERTRQNREEILALYDERFFRMWEFYLAGAITWFENGDSTNYQLQYVRERRAVPLRRDYMIEDLPAVRQALVNGTDGG